MKTETKNKLKKLKVNFIVLMIFTFVALFIAEVMLRIVSPRFFHNIDNREICMPDTVLGWRLRENVSYSYIFEGRNINYQTNEKGFRVNTGYSPGNSDIRILAIGDSYLEAQAVQNEETAPQILAQKLSDKHEMLITTDNCACSGWGLKQYLFRARQLLKEDAGAYQLGIVFVYINDFTVSMDLSPVKPAIIGVRPFTFPVADGKLRIRESIINPMDDFLAGKSHLFSFLKSRELEFLFARMGLKEVRPIPNVFFKDDKNDPVWDSTAYMLNLIGEAFGEYEIPVLFAFIPSVYQIYPEEHSREMETIKYPQRFLIGNSLIDA